MTIRSDAAGMHSVFNLSCARLAAEAPKVYPAWSQCLQHDVQTLQGFPTHSCSVAGHTMAPKFAAFIQPLLHGKVLDIGCGPQPIPLYLERWPLDLISGIDPQPPFNAPHPFQFTQGVGEYLPWLDATFQTVILATSFDHCLLPDLVITEAARVLPKNGRLLIWNTFFDQSSNYEPRQGIYRPRDSHHLFQMTWRDFCALCQPAFQLVAMQHELTPYSAHFSHWRKRAEV